jgi:hypothetical protein
VLTCIKLGSEMRWWHDGTSVTVSRGERTLKDYVKSVEERQKQEAALLEELQSHGGWDIKEQGGNNDEENLRRG